MTAPTDVVSLFAGIGLIDLAAQRAGLTTRLMCEIDGPCRTVLTRRFPDAVIHDDVRTLTADDLHRAGAVPGRTVLTAGFPCQDLSVAGRRRGLGEGTRSGLFWQVDRLLAEFRPAWVLLENVPGLLSATCACPGDARCGHADCPGETHQVKGGACDGQCIARHGGVMGAVLGSLGERGYGFAYRVLDARYFGVPQRRRRVFVVGHLGGTGAAPAQVLLEPESVRGDSPQGSEAGQGVASAARERVTGSGRTVGFHLTQDPISSDEMSPAMSAGNGQGCATIGVAVGVLGDQARTMTAEGFDAGEDGTGRGTPVIAFDYVPNAAHSLMSHGGNVKHDSTMMTYVAETAPTIMKPNGGWRVDAEGAAGGALISQSVSENQRGELNLTETAALSTGGGKPGQGYPAVTDGVTVRRLTPLECERLQGAPDAWTDVDDASDSQRYKELGNSVAVPVLTWTFRRLVDVAERAA